MRLASLKRSTILVSAILLFPILVSAAEPVPISAQAIPKQQAVNVLPSNILNAVNYKIDPVVTNNGKNDIFVLSSAYPPLVAEGQQELARRISEIRAMIALDKVSKGKEFANAMVRAGKAPFEAAWDLVTEPVDTVSGIFSGIGTTFKRVGGMITQDRGELEDAKVKEALGVSAVKRKYAAELEVDVYSSNKLLQDKLNSVAWAVFAGGLTTKVAFSLPENEKVVTALRVGAAIKTLNSLIENATPEDLRSLNEGKLRAMNIPQDVITSFLGHTWYSPRHQTTIVAALEGLPNVANRAEFIKRAVTAKNEREAFVYQYGAEMLLEYDQKTARLKEFVGFGQTVLAMDDKQRLVVVIPYDHLNYTNVTANSINHIDAGLIESMPDHGKVAVFVNIASPDVEAALLHKGWAVMQLKKFAKE